MDEGTITTAVREPGALIERPRLTKILDESEARIIMLCAPAGYGKTTLARQWTEGRQGAVWYAGGPAMADVAAFAAGLAAAMSPDPEAAVERIESLAARGLPAHGLARALVPVAERCRLLVLDDYHYAIEAGEPDQLVTELLGQTTFRLLLTTRVRPSWVTPRQQVYGETLVLEMSELAFDEAEALAVLGRPEAGGLSVLAQAKGWPAVIALAAVRASPEGPSEPLEAGELYDFFAEDLFRLVPARVQQGLFLLALAGDAEPGLAKSLVGDGFDEVVAEGTARGFLSRGAGGVLSIHPLLRTFLLAKLAEQGDEVAGSLVERVVGELASRRRWDACLTALEQIRQPDLTVTTIEMALHDLLSSGRITTLKRWLTLAISTAATHPVLLLLEAAIASCGGNQDRARVLGARAGELLQGDESAWAYLAAARAAHLQGDSPAAGHWARQAELATTSASCQRQALWIAFITASENEPTLAAGILDRLRALGGDTVSDSFRLLSAEAVLHYQTGFPQRAMLSCDRALSLLEQVNDPFARTNLLHVSSFVAVELARYEEALQRSHVLITEGQTSGLEFVIGHALGTRAAALVGMRRLLDARRTVDQIAREHTRDHHAFAHSELQRSKLFIALADLDRAAKVLEQHVLTDSVAVPTRAEFAAYRGLVDAARGKADFRGLQAARDNPRLVRFCESRTILTLAIAMAALTQHGNDANRIAIAALQEAFARNQLDVIVTSCRAFPKLVQVAAGDPELRRALTHLLTTSRDFDIGRQAGLEMFRAPRRHEQLSPREREVYEHLANGRSNPEIARALFISESTTKVHVRHIFEKLGVHSRAEAAQLASTMDSASPRQR